MPDVDKAILEFLTTLMAQAGTQRDMQTRRDAWMQYQQHHGAWVRDVVQAITQALSSLDTGARTSTLSGAGLELVSDDVVENKIIASRMALTVGILFGIYSSVFVAASIAMWLGVKREDLVKTVRKEGEPSDPDDPNAGATV